ncbi:class I SAM-dependent methyltransferase [Mycobacterium sp. Y57]|uniref:class I SAM-dependent methyltransferase n=1 Tax=Mycolicibacterium xanthum TaxID=2796469 RepID=UPI001C85C837|nr:class I SAM-dependent methyltransferase [Mycolicibacterium xanthum]MBX7430705.1 class I SAM-dependent methyltransferase [Mycolicibacterium xanthum]
MTEQRMDWDSAYQQGSPPPWSIGAPQPELAALIEQGKVRGRVLDAGCGEAELSLALAAQGFSVVGLDGSAIAVAAARSAAAARGLTSTSFEVADVTDFDGYDGQFDTVMDSGLLHALPVERRQAYVRAIRRAAAPGAGLFILAFAQRPFGGGGPGPAGFTAEELRDTVATLWTVDEVRSASLYANDVQVPGGPGPAREAQRDDQGRLMMPGFLLLAHKE